MSFIWQQEYLAILKEELVPAMGCTEPIALAYAAAVARRALGKEPEGIVARCSGNMIKNVRCVSIPNSGGLTGIEAACILGAIAGDPNGGMETLERVNDADRQHAAELLSGDVCTVAFLDSEIPLHFILELHADNDVVTAEVRHLHTNIVSLIRNGVELITDNGNSNEIHYEADRSHLSIEGIKQFSDTVDIQLIQGIFDRQIRFNMAIAQTGMNGSWGIGIGKAILDCCTPDTATRMKAYAAAASEARMGGCDLPVIINSGSGNQGIASSVPVIIYAKENSIPDEKLYRALAFSALLTIYQKKFIGTLSAFCGAVSASCASGAAITYLDGGDIAQIKATVDNTLANIPGIICDGAKISCAAKIASSLDAAMMAHYLAMHGKSYEAYTGILKEDAGETISCVGYIGKIGMRQTDKEIIKLMLE